MLTTCSIVVQNCLAVAQMGSDFTIAAQSLNVNAGLLNVYPRARKELELVPMPTWMALQLVLPRMTRIGHGPGGHGIAMFPGVPQVMVGGILTPAGRNPLVVVDEMMIAGRNPLVVVDEMMILQNGMESPSLC